MKSNHHKKEKILDIGELLKGTITLKKVGMAAKGKLGALEIIKTTSPGGVNQINGS